MSTVRALTLIDAHTALMRVWHATDTVPWELRRECMRIACELKVAMTGIGIEVEKEAEYEPTAD